MTTPAESQAPFRASHPVDASAPLFIVLNVGSGHSDVRVVQAKIEAKLSAAGRRFSIHKVTVAKTLPATVSEVVATARSSGGIVVAAGGDGTIHTVAQATLGSGCPFGVLPLGTFNYFSRTHGIPSELEGACDVLLGTRAYEVQVGMLNDQVFLVNASLGLYPKLLEDREQAKSRLGRSRVVAFGAAVATLVRPHRRLFLDLESSAGKRALVTPTLFVSNNRLQLESVGLEGAPTEQRRLVAVGVEPGARALLRTAVSALLGRLNQSPAALSFDFATMSVRPRGRGKRIKVAMDGEVTWMKAPLEFRVASQPLLLLRPQVVVGDPG